MLFFFFWASYFCKIKVEEQFQHCLKQCSVINHKQNVWLLIKSVYIAFGHVTHINSILDFNSCLTFFLFKWRAFIYLFVIESKEFWKTVMQIYISVAKPYCYGNYCVAQNLKIIFLFLILCWLHQSFFFTLFTLHHIVFGLNWNMSAAQNN